MSASPSTLHRQSARCFSVEARSEARASHQWFTISCRSAAGCDTHPRQDGRPVGWVGRRV